MEPVHLMSIHALRPSRDGYGRCAGRADARRLWPLVSSLRAAEGTRHKAGTDSKVPGGIRVHSLARKMCFGKDFVFKIWILYIRNPGFFFFFGGGGLNVPHLYWWKWVYSQIGSGVRRRGCVPSQQPVRQGGVCVPVPPHHFKCCMLWLRSGPCSSYVPGIYVRALALVWHPTVVGEWDT